MKLVKTSQWFRIKGCIGEPDVDFKGWYHIERKSDIDGIVWYGMKTNWKKLPNENFWRKLGNMDFVPCEEPIYETLYQQLLRNEIS